MPSPQNNVMCHPCQCVMAGSLSPICNEITSQCPCKDGVTGLRCDTVLLGQYVKALDAIIFEAENAILSTVWELYCDERCPHLRISFFHRESPAAVIQPITLVQAT